MTILISLFFLISEKKGNWILSTFFSRFFLFLFHSILRIPTSISRIPTPIPHILTLIPHISRIPNIPTPIPRIPTLIPCIPILIPRVLNLITRVPNLIPRIRIIPLIPFPDSSFQLLQIALRQYNNNAIPSIKIPLSISYTK